jgi:hypothetical protein
VRRRVDLRPAAIGSAKNSRGSEWEEATHNEEGQAR